MGARSCRVRRGGPSARPAGRRPAMAPPARPAACGRAGGPRARPYECAAVRCSSPAVASMTSFVERHGLWTAAQEAAAVELEVQAERAGLEVIRLSFPDQHGILRGKTIMRAELAGPL